MWFPRIPMGMYPGRIAESCGTTYDKALASTTKQILPNPPSRLLVEVLLVEAADFNRLQSLLVASHDHCVKAVLNPRKHLGVASEDLDNLGVRLLYGADRQG